MRIWKVTSRAKAGVAAACVMIGVSTGVISDSRAEQRSSPASSDVMKLFADDPNKFFIEIEKYLPVYATLRTHEPKLYKEFITKIRSSARAGMSVDMLANAVYPLLAEYIAKKLPVSPDEIFLQMVKIDMDRAKELKVSNPTMCVKLLLGQPTGNMNSYLSRRTAMAGLQAIDALIRAPSTAKSAPMSEQELGVVLLPLMTADASRLHMTVEDYSVALEGKADPTISCAVGASFLARILEQPKDRAAKIMRSLQLIEP